MQSRYRRESKSYDCGMELSVVWFSSSALALKLRDFRVKIPNQSGADDSERRHCIASHSQARLWALYDRFGQIEVRTARGGYGTSRLPVSRPFLRWATPKAGIWYRSHSNS
ncbi:hypothetical protein RRG08_025595 [Elysia crispata]|uniref:Uncharacterized protein n=1 Tax=Elysia crispata TaxID=231223 RepID=A0AAE0YEX6_9GAST|nr:hypothetical protein RRG08_025595 [Elysia crispata]